MIHIGDFQIEEDKIVIDYTKTNVIKGNEEYITQSYDLSQFQDFMLKHYKDIVESYTETDFLDYSNSSGDGEILKPKFIDWRTIYEYVTIDMVQQFLRRL